MAIEYSGVLVNRCYGGFEFSDEFNNEFDKRYGEKEEYRHCESLRKDPRAIALFKELGADKSSGQFAKLDLVEVPTKMLDYVNISEYDGLEGCTIDWARAHKKNMDDFMNKITSESNPLTQEEEEKELRLFKTNYISLKELQQAYIERRGQAAKRRVKYESHY